MDFEFAFPPGQWPLWAAIGAAALAALAFALLRLEARRRVRMHAFVEAALAPRLLAGYDARVRKPLFWLPLVGAACLLLALAQPRWGRAWQQIARAGRDFMVVLDVSESMNAEDLKPKRLDRAKQKIEALAERFPADRFGLIAFSGAAAMQSPLSDDHNYFRAVLQAVDTDVLAEEGSNIEAAIEEAVAVFEQHAEEGSPGDSSSRAIVLVTDGDEVSGDAVAAARAASAHAAVLVLGVGTPEGGTVRYPQWMEQFAPPPDRNRSHETKLNWELLGGLANAAGGIAVRISPDNADIDQIARELELIESDALATGSRFNLVHRYRWPLAAAAACFAAEAAWIVIMPALRRRCLHRMQAAGEEARYA